LSAFTLKRELENEDVDENNFLRRERFGLAAFRGAGWPTQGGVDMSKLDNVRLGDTVVVVFTEALVLSQKEI
jgi:hypothetical protein